MNQSAFSFSITATKKASRARAGLLGTPHGSILTPIFMPVGTVGTVKALSAEDLLAVGAQIILANTYHLYLRPGDEVVQKLGGLHAFMRWEKPILTDSGGYQVSSLGHFKDDMTQNQTLVKRTIIDDEGATFFSHLDGSKHRFTPKDSIHIQRNLGADIIMAFDEATPNRGKGYARKAMMRTHHWLVKSMQAWRELEEIKREDESPQALFGIIQGGNYKAFRRESAEFVVSQHLPGIAIGGGSIGKNPQETEENVSWIQDLLPKDRPLYLMGVGVNPEDILSAIQIGADMFDCVAPTRLARLGYLYNGNFKNGHRWRFVSEFKKGRVAIGNARFRLDQSVIDEDCDCLTCAGGYTRAYLHHLFKTRELLYYRLASMHNVRFMIRLTEQVRNSMTDI